MLWRIVVISGEGWALEMEGSQGVQGPPALSSSTGVLCPLILGFRGDTRYLKCLPHAVLQEADLLERFPLIP